MYISLNTFQNYLECKYIYVYIYTYTYKSAYMYTYTYTYIHLYNKQLFRVGYVFHNYLLILAIIIFKLIIK